MKKILLLFGMFIGLLATAQQGDYTVPIGWGNSHEATHRQRVEDSAGNYYYNTAPHMFDLLKSYDIDPVYMFIPSGNVAGYAMAQIPTDGTGDLTVTRASTAYTINSDLKLEEVPINEPRYDFSSGIPVLLTEDAGENLLTRPVSLPHSDWKKSGASIEGDPSTAGSDLVSGWDFTGGWINYLTGSHDDADSYTSTGAGGILKSGLLTGDKLYLLHVVGTTTSASGIDFVSSVGSQTYGSVATGAFDYTVQFFTNTISTDFAFRNLSAGTTDITTFTIQQVGGFQAPSEDYPTSAFFLKEDGSTGTHRIEDAVTVTSGEDITLSVYVKAAEREWILLRETSSNKGYYFDVKNGVIGNAWAGGAAKDYDIKYLSNGYYRISITITSISTSANMYLALCTANATASYTGDGTSGVYLAFPQVEENDHSSSWTFSGTEGATSLRSADAVTGGGDAATFANVNESGCLIARIAAHSDDLTIRAFGLSDGTPNNRIILIYNSTSNTVQYVVYVGGVIQTNISYAVADITEFNSIVVRWAPNDFALFINKTKVGTDVSGSTFLNNPLSEIALDAGETTANFYGKTEYILVTPYLTDSQIQSLP